MKQTRLDKFFNIKYKNNEMNKNNETKIINKKILNNNCIVTPNNTPVYGSTDNIPISSINIFQLNDKIKGKYQDILFDLMVLVKAIQVKQVLAQYYIKMIKKFGVHQDTLEYKQIIMQNVSQ